MEWTTTNATGRHRTREKLQFLTYNTHDNTPHYTTRHHATLHPLPRNFDVLGNGEGTKRRAMLLWKDLVEIFPTPSILVVFASLLWRNSDVVENSSQGLGVLS